MSILEKIIEAKEIIGDDAALKIAEYYHIEQFNEHDLKGCCPFHREDTPSFIWSKKDKCFTCFGCRRRFSILDMYVDGEGSYPKAVKKLLTEANIEFSLNSFKYDNEDYFTHYRYPKEETNESRKQVEEYSLRRGISASTLDYAGVKQDENGNVVFELRDLSGKLLATKYRPSHKIKKAQAKMWWQKNADTCPILYNISKIDISRPLLIVEGYYDALSVIEAGYRNVVSIPGGAEDLNWIEFNYDFLQNIDQIILWFDNDATGESGKNKVIQRIGEYRCKVVKTTQDDIDAVNSYYQEYGSSCTKTDANNILLSCGAYRILDLIETAEEIPNKKLKYLMDCEIQSVQDIEKTSTGIRALDKMLYGNLFPCFTIYSGKTGCVDSETEFFNGIEWKKIADYQKDDKVLVYDRSGNARLEYPSLYHKYPSDGLWEFKSKRSVNQCLSKEHNVYYLNSDGTLTSKPFKEIMEEHSRSTSGFSGKFITTFNYSGTGISLSDGEIKLMCAVICEGILYDKSNNCRFHIKKERKKTRLREILKECNLGFREVQSIEDEYTDFYLEVPRIETEFSSYWYGCNQHQLGIVCDNVLFWNGSSYATRNNYIQKSLCFPIKSTADFIQFAFSACGMRTSIVKKPIKYTIIVSNYIHTGISNRKFSKKVKIIKKKNTDGFKYCFTTSTGMWVMRRKNCIAVTGNSGKSTVANIASLIAPIEKGYKTFVFSGELPEGQLADWVVTPLAGYNHIQRVVSPEAPERPFYTPTPDAINAIRKHYRKDMILYSDEDGLEVSGVSLLSAMEDAYRRNGCRVFLIDNLMCLSFENLNEDNKWETQKKFILKLMKFAEKYKVCINLILHPKKMSAFAKEPTADDLHGASEIGNLCHRLLWVDKLNPDDNCYNTKITVIKDRPTQAAGKHCELYYDEKTRRVYSDTKELRAPYSWESTSKIKYPSNIDRYLICHDPVVPLPHEDSAFQPPM